MTGKKRSTEAKAAISAGLLALNSLVIWSGCKRSEILHFQNKRNLINDQQEPELAKRLYLTPEEKNLVKL
jgi:hypothetical protein